VAPHRQYGAATLCVMAIVKVSYTQEKAGAKAAVRYIAHRPGKDGAKISRTLFGNDGVMARQLAYRMIDAAEKNTYFYRLAISPDPLSEDTHKDIHLWEITDQTMTQLAEQLQTDILYVATEHNDHAPHRHVHVLALVPRRLSKSDLAALRTAATQAAGLQRTSRDVALAQPIQEQEVEQGWEY
jgi:hypothetical protein